MPTLTNNITFNEEKKFAFYCRTGNYKKLSGIKTNRIKHYRKLVWNVIDDTLQTAFPLTYQLLSGNEWNDITKSFFSNHACQAFQLWKMPKEFIEYYSSQSSSLKNKYPFLEDLLLFEWKEIEIFMMEDAEIVDYDIEGNLLIDDVIINPHFEIIHLQYPVHIKIAKNITNNDKSNYFLLAYRNNENFEVQFIDISIIYAWLIENIVQQKKSAYHLAKEAAKIFNIEEKILLTHFEAFLAQMQQQNFILGFKK